MINLYLTSKFSLSLINSIINLNNSITRRQISVKNIENDVEAKEVSVEQRNCRFPDENIVEVHKLYSFSACSESIQ